MNEEKNYDILTVNNTRVWYPWELKKLVQAIPKMELRINFEAGLYSGARYIELKRLLEKPEMYMASKGKIHFDSFAIRKTKIRIKERWVTLNPIGRRVIEAFIAQDRDLPAYVTWSENLARWSGMAGLKPDRVSAKSTRKTWECYLMTKYPSFANHIFLSQGHSDLVALRHYVNLPFDENDKKMMDEFTYGWEP